MGNAKCIRSWSECSKVIKDSLGKYFGVDFVEAFKVGNSYKVISAENDIYEIQNEQGNISEFGREVKNFFELTE
jgi:hypothetical protein